MIYYFHDLLFEQIHLIGPLKKSMLETFCAGVGPQPKKWNFCGRIFIVENGFSFKWCNFCNTVNQEPITVMGSSVNVIIIVNSA